MYSVCVLAEIWWYLTSSTQLWQLVGYCEHVMACSSIHDTAYESMNAHLLCLGADLVVSYKLNQQQAVCT